MLSDTNPRPRMQSLSVKKFLCSIDSVTFSDQDSDIWQIIKNGNFNTTIVNAVLVDTGSEFCVIPINSDDDPRHSTSVMEVSGHDHGKTGTTLDLCYTFLFQSDKH